MGQAIPVRRDYSAGEVRQFAKRAKDAAQARRLLAIAAVLDGASREDAAKIGGMDRQTLRDWVIRFNEQGPDGSINIPSPGVPPKLDDTHRAFLARIVKEGPIPAVHGVVRWRACDLIMRLYEEFALSVSDDTIYRALKDLGFSHVSARPKAYKQDAEAITAFKKTSPYAWPEIRATLAPGTPIEVWLPGRDAGGSEEQAHLSLGHKGLAFPAPSTTNARNRPMCLVRSARTRNRCGSRAAGLQHRSHAASSQRDRYKGHAGRSRHSDPRSSRMARRQRPQSLQATSRSCRCRRAHPSSPSSILKKTFGSLCGRTGCRTVSSNPSTTSSITAVTPGTRSSTSPGK